jgi:hypothetical protein
LGGGNEVRSSIIRHSALQFSDSVTSSKKVDDFVAILVEATENYKEPLTVERIFGWHKELFEAEDTSRFAVGETHPMFWLNLTWRKMT